MFLGHCVGNNKRKAKIGLERDIANLKYLARRQLAVELQTVRAVHGHGNIVCYHFILCQLREIKHAK